MNYVVTLIIATVSLYAGAKHLGQGLDSYWDFVAFAVVLGGTVAVSVVVLPWRFRSHLRDCFRRLIHHKSLQPKEFLTVCLKVIEVHLSGQGSPTVYGKSFEKQVLREGIELLNLGFDRQRIQQILEERIYQHHSRMKAIGNAIRSLAKYPPAFGLAGTVLGLVHLMQGVSEGISAEETGIRMALALVATFYGLIIANLIVNPAGESIAHLAEEDIKAAEISLETILLARDQANLLEAQEVLNSHLVPTDRIDYIDSVVSSEAA